MKMERKVLKNIIKIINKMGNGLGGMKMDRRVVKKLTRMGKKMGIWNNE